MIKKYLPFIKNPVTVISFLMIYATYIYFYQLGSKPLWIDELASIYNSYDLSRLATIIKQETNMWLYFFLLHFWMKLGESAAIVRSFSAVFTIATIPLIYLLGKEILNKKLGFIGAFFFTFHGVVIYFAQETRSYALFIFFVTLSSLLFLKTLNLKTPKLFILYLTATIAAIYSHTFGFLLFISQFAYVFFVIKEKKEIFRFVLASCIILISTAPLLYNEQQLSGGLLDWIAPVTSKDLGGLFLYFSSSSLLLLILFIVLFFIGTIQIFKNKYKTLIYLFFWFVLPISVIFIVSLLFKPLFINRYFYFCLIPFLLIGSVPLADSKLKLWKFAGIVIISLLLANTQRNYLINYQKQDWKPRTKLLFDSYKHGDALLIYPDRMIKSIEYFERMGLSNTKLLTYYLSNNEVNRKESEQQLQEDLQRIDTIANKHPRIMLYMRISELDVTIPEREFLYLRLKQQLLKTHTQESVLIKSGMVLETYTKKQNGN